MFPARIVHYAARKHALPEHELHFLRNVLGWVVVVVSAVTVWGYSSAGRAPALHAGGQRFDPAYLHHLSSLSKFIHLVYLTMITEKFYQLFFKKLETSWKTEETFKSF